MLLKPSLYQSNTFVLYTKREELEVTGCLLIAHTERTDSSTYLQYTTYFSQGERSLIHKKKFVHEKHEGIRRDKAIHYDKLEKKKETIFSEYLKTTRNPFIHFLECLRQTSQNQAHQLQQNILWAQRLMLLKIIQF